MGTAVFIESRFFILVTQGVGFVGALAYLLCLQGLDFSPELLYDSWHCLHDGVLGRHVVGLLGHLSCKVYIGVSEVSHFRPVF